MKKVISHIKSLMEKNTITNYIVLHAQNTVSAEWYVQQMSLLTGKEPVSVINISPVIGMNAGVGAASVAIMLD
jgi:fatty acid-binding protein DegV